MIGNNWDKTIVTDITMYYSCTVGRGRLAIFVEYWSLENKTAIYVSFVQMSNLTSTLALAWELRATWGYGDGTHFARKRF